MPLIGDVSLLGLTTKQAKVLVEKHLSNGYLVSPSVSIEILQYQPFYILGEIRVPGQYDFTPGMNVLNAVAMAGGFTYRAKKSDIEIKRYKHHEDLSAQYQYSVEAHVYPGDTIIIKERFF